jgi:hypothetical protein
MDLDPDPLPRSNVIKDVNLTHALIIYLSRVHPAPYRQGNITVTDKDGQIMSAESFLSAIHPAPAPSTSATPAKAPPVYGGALRWALAVDQDKTFQVEVQSLPTAAANLQKKYFSSDNSVSVLLGSYPLAADTFTHPPPAGLVPQFFSPYRHLALHHLQHNPDDANDIISSVNSRFLHMEHLSPEEAANYLKAKRGRTAKGVVAFPPPTVSRKRTRPQAADISESGIDHTFQFLFAHFLVMHKIILSSCIRYGR